VSDTVAAIAAVVKVGPKRRSAGIGAVGVDAPRHQRGHQEVVTGHPPAHLSTIMKLRATGATIASRVHPGTY
jgi:hypothetical protein